jgi:hypothetical protein
MKFFKTTKVITSKNGELHFTRFAILEAKFFSIYIHKIYLGDKDPYLHNHPWNFFNLILKGCYVEELENNKLRLRNFLDFGFYDALTFHKINAVIKPVTTLVITGKRYNDWGYYIPETDEIISNTYYRNMKKNEQ